MFICARAFVCVRGGNEVKNDNYVDYIKVILTVEQYINKEDLVYKIFWF